VIDDGIQPLEAFVDGDAEGIAATLEFDAGEQIVPALYVRSGGRLTELVLPPHPLRRYDGPDYRDALARAVRPLGL
jgi:hypothetical protein